MKKVKYDLTLKEAELLCDEAWTETNRLKEKKNFLVLMIRQAKSNAMALTKQVRELRLKKKKG